MNSRPLLGFFHDGLSIPPKEGISVHVYELARALATSGKLKVLVIIADRGRATEAQLANEPFDSLLINPDNYYDRTKVAEIIKKHAINIVQNYNTYYIASILGPIAKQLNIPLIAEHHDLEADLAFLRQTNEEAAYYQSIQQQAIAFSSLSRFMSPHDFAKIRPLLAPDLARKTFLLPIAFAPKTFSHSAPLHGAPRVIFVGNMAYKPNTQGALFLGREVAPLVPDITFHIIGRGSQDLPLHDIANVQLMGEVDDLAQEMAAAKVGLAPIQEGSGLKIKIITYLEAGLPVVGSSIALHGFPENASLIQADSAETIATALTNLLDHQEVWGATSRAALALFDTAFNLQTSLPQLIDTYMHCIETYQRPDIEDTILTPDMKMFPWHRELQSNDYTPVQTPVLIKGASR